MDGKDYTVEMFASVFSGKKKIMQNEETIFFDSKYVCTFAHTNLDTLEISYSHGLSEDFF